MDWATLIEIALQIVKECQEERGYETTLDNLQSRPLVRWVLRGRLREHGLRGRQLRQAVGMAVEHLEDANDDDLRQLMSDAAEYQLAA